jgi:acetyltransferase
VLWENTTMLAMCAELGFHIADDPDDPGVRIVTLPVCTECLDAQTKAREARPGSMA